MLDGSEHQITKRPHSPLTPLVVGEETHVSRSQQSSAKATRTRSPLSQPISKPSEQAAAVARIDGDASVMSPFDAVGMAIKQQAVDLHGHEQFATRRDSCPPKRAFLLIHLRVADASTALRQTDAGNLG